MISSRNGSFKRDRWMPITHEVPYTTKKQKPVAGKGPVTSFSASQPEQKTQTARPSMEPLVKPKRLVGWTWLNYFQVVHMLQVKSPIQLYNCHTKICTVVKIYYKAHPKGSGAGQCWSFRETSPAQARKSRRLHSWSHKYIAMDTFANKERDRWLEFLWTSQQKESISYNVSVPICSLWIRMMLQASDTSSSHFSPKVVRCRTQLLAGVLTPVRTTLWINMFNVTHH